jgi:hypothetical protein
MDQDLKDAIDIVKSMVEQGENIGYLLKQHDSGLNSYLEELGCSITSEVKRLAKLRSSLSKRCGADTDDEESDDEDFFFSIPEMKFVRWREAISQESPPREHSTLQVPSSQPTPDDLNPSQEQARYTLSVRPKEALPDSDSKHKSPEVAVDRPRPFKRAGLAGDLQPLEELPDCIRICSQRLTIFLDYNIHDSSLNWSSYQRTPFIILRPFKFLVYKGQEIRTALTSLERIRREQFPSRSEEEHDEDWKAVRPVDDLPPQVVSPADLEPAQLTALIKDLRCLTHFMDGYIEPTMTIGQLDHVFFTDLWFVFPARSLIYVRDKKVPHKIWKVIQRTGGRRDGVGLSLREGPPGHHLVDRTQGFQPFVIDCFHLDYDGTRYVQTYRRVQIDYFEGTQPLTSLPVMPIRAAEQAALVDRQALVERGKEFVKCTRPSYRQYVGRNQILRPNGAKLHDKDADIPENATRYAEWIESEVMVDFEKALQEMPGWQPGISDLELFKDEVNGFRCIDVDNVWDSKLSEDVIYEEWDKCQRWDKERTHPTEEEDLLLLPARVFAFVFRIRKWGKSWSNFS